MRKIVNYRHPRRDVLNIHLQGVVPDCGSFSLSGVIFETETYMGLISDSMGVLNRMKPGQLGSLSPTFRRWI